jgi:hypothetical protein
VGPFYFGDPVERWATFTSALTAGAERRSDRNAQLRSLDHLVFSL